MMNRCDAESEKSCIFALELIQNDMNLRDIKKDIKEL